MPQRKRVSRKQIKAKGTGTPGNKEPDGSTHQAAQLEGLQRLLQARVPARGPRILHVGRRVHAAVPLCDVPVIMMMVMRRRRGHCHNGPSAPWRQHKSVSCTCDRQPPSPSPRSINPKTHLHVAEPREARLAVLAHALADGAVVHAQRGEDAVVGRPTEVHALRVHRVVCAGAGNDQWW